MERISGDGYRERLEYGGQPQRDALASLPNPVPSESEGTVTDPNLKNKIKTANKDGLDCSSCSRQLK